MSRPIIEVSKLSKIYRLGEIGATSLREETARSFRKLRGLEPKKEDGEFWALKDVSFSVEPGEFVGIVGKNGAGKSTLLKVISRITEPSHGRIRLCGRLAALLEVGTGMHPELTGRENIYLNGTILGMRKREIDQKIEQIIDFSGIEKHIDTPVKRYSSGMNVRLGFAVAAHLEPEILIVDEVLAVGDADFRNKCAEKMTSIVKDGRTILFVSHNLSLVRSLCPRSVLLESGSLVHDGSTAGTLDIYNASSSKLHGKKVSERTDRHGTGATRIIDLAINHQSGQTAEVAAGSPLNIQIKTSTALSGSVVRLSIYDKLDRMVTHFRSDAFAELTDTSHRATKFHIQIENTFLTPGEYKINVAVMHGNEICDRIADIKRLNIIEGDYNSFTITKVDPEAHAFIPHKWVFDDN